MEQPVTSLSGGNQQKVALARLLHQDADVLLLDEPTRGIDIAARPSVYQTISECAERGKAVLMISSYLPELFGMLRPAGCKEPWVPVGGAADKRMDSRVGYCSGNGQ